MGLSHIFYKELHVDNNNVFPATLAEDNKIEEVSIKKDKKYMITGLFIKQKTDTDVIVPNLNARNSLGDMIRPYEEEKIFDITIHFEK